MPTPERNARCPCGSGKKYKQCCLRLQARAQTSMPLRMRQVVALTSQTAPSLFSAPSVSHQEVSSADAHSSQPTAPPSPKTPSYDSLMKRAFGAAVQSEKAETEVSSETDQGDTTTTEQETERS